MRDLGWRSSSISQLLLVFTSIALQIIQGSCDNPSASKEGEASDSGSSSVRKKELNWLLICLGVAIIVLLSFLFFKLWKKKKRQEQHARFLKLFEQDDELDDELGLQN